MNHIDLSSVAGIQNAAIDCSQPVAMRTLKLDALLSVEYWLRLHVKCAAIQGVKRITMITRNHLKCAGSAFGITMLYIESTITTRC